LESSLYLPVKRFLEKLGFEVKGEVCGCDLVALASGEPSALVVCELKLTFSLELILQAVDRSAVCDEVWLAVGASRRGRGREHDPRARKLCRLLGVGLLSVSTKGKVEVLVEPVPWRPRRDAKRRSRIVEEHRRRQGDPTLGGQHAPADHDSLSAAGSGLCGSPIPSPGASARLEERAARCSEDFASERVWLVRQG
jgi:hypothetical protein